MRNFDLLPPLPPSIREQLGAAPPVTMISALLLLYAFSATILTLSRMMGGVEKFGGFGHVAFLAGFYGFYHLAGALDGNFWAVFAAGLTIISLDAYHLWNHCMDGIRREKEALAEQPRRPPPPE